MKNQESFTCRHCKEVIKHNESHLNFIVICKCKILYRICKNKEIEEIPIVKIKQNGPEEEYDYEEQY